jgi:diguanylate cyclase (GGDEF)-like protein
MMVRYVAALLILAVITAISFGVVRHLIDDMQSSEALIAEAADLRSSIHKTMLALDGVAAGDPEAARLAGAEAETLSAGMDRMLISLLRADADPAAWSLVRGSADSLEPNVRMLVQRALEASPGRSAPHAAPPTAHGEMQMQPRGAAVPEQGHAAKPPAAAERGGHGSPAAGHGAGNAPAMAAVDYLIERLREGARSRQEWSGTVHDLLGFGTMLVLLVEAVIIFRPLLKKAETETKRAARAVSELEHLASHDALTGLLNRGQIDRVLALAVADAASANRPLGLILLDLDEFKPINDTLGHAAGDAVLVEVGARIQAALRPSDIVGRLGGDEFIIVLPEVGHEADVKEVADRILACVGRPVHFNSHEITPAASIGFAVFPVAGSDVPSLLAAADLAMYSAKRTGRGRVSEFSDWMRAESERSRAMKKSLADAFEQRQLEVHFQCIRRAEDMKVAGVEALVRWRHPQKGLLLPGEFLDDIRKAGMGIALTHLVLSEALSQYAVWTAAGLSLDAVHVNVEADFLREPEAAAVVQRLLATKAVAASGLVLDVAGQVQMEDERVQRCVGALHDLGVGIALGDFGTRGASIVGLNHPGFTMVKLGRDLVDQYAGAPDGLATIAPLSALLRSMGKTILAEGVETEKQAKLLKAADVDLLQGFLYHRPQSAAETAAYLHERQRRPGLALAAG